MGDAQERTGCVHAPEADIRNGGRCDRGVTLLSTALALAVAPRRGAGGDAAAADLGRLRARRGDRAVRGEEPRHRRRGDASNNEEMIAKLRATGGAGFDLAQPSHDRIYAAQLEYGIYKPLDLSQDRHRRRSTPNLLEGRQGQHDDRRRASMPCRISGARPA